VLFDVEEDGVVELLYNDRVVDELLEAEELVDHFDDELLGEDEYGVMLGVVEEDELLLDHLLDELLVGVE